MTAWVVAMAAAVAAACTAADTDTTIEIRSDTAPLTKRFPAIGDPVAASWVTWTSAGRDAPGPTTYFLDAVLTLRPQTTAALTHHTAAEGKTPDIAEALRPEVSPGPFLTGPALDDALSTEGWVAAAYLDPERNQLVLSSFDD